MADTDPAGGTARAWRVIGDDGERRPRINLARDEALAACNAGEPTVRLWRSDLSVVLGRAQVAEAEADMAACADLGIPVLRRFTGGGAVFHDPGNLNVSVVVARDDEMVTSRSGHGLAGIYSLVLEPIAAAVRSLAAGTGSAVTADERAIWIGEGKVSGMAAWLGARTVLVHATLIVDSDLDLLERALAGPGAPGNALWEHTKSRRVRVTSLAREGLATDPATVDAAVIAAFNGEAAGAGGTGAVGAAETEVGAASRRGFTADEQAAAARLVAERYGHVEWHLEGRSGTAV